MELEYTMKRPLTKSEKQLLKYLAKDYILLPTNQEKKPLVSNWNSYNQHYYKEKRNTCY